MIYKRGEYFRYVFNAPFDAEFRIILDKDEGKQTGIGQCQLIDISPGGAKILTEFDIPFGKEPVQIELTFKLYNETITVNGALVWRDKAEESFHYGFEYEPTVEVKNLIIEELKLLSKATMEERHKLLDPHGEK